MPMNFFTTPGFGESMSLSEEKHAKGTPLPAEVKSGWGSLHEVVSRLTFDFLGKSTDLDVSPLSSLTPGSSRGGSDSGPWKLRTMNATFQAAEQARQDNASKSDCPDNLNSLDSPGPVPRRVSADATDVCPRSHPVRLSDGSVGSADPDSSMSDKVQPQKMEEETHAAVSSVAPGERTFMASPFEAEPCLPKIPQGPAGHSDEREKGEAGEKEEGGEEESDKDKIEAEEGDKEESESETGSVPRHHVAGLFEALPDLEQEERESQSGAPSSPRSARGSSPRLAFPSPQSRASTLPDPMPLHWRATGSVPSSAGASPIKPISLASLAPSPRRGVLSPHFSPQKPVVSAYNVVERWRESAPLPEPRVVEPRAQAKATDAAPTVGLPVPGSSTPQRAKSALLGYYAAPRSGAAPSRLRHRSASCARAEEGHRSAAGARAKEGRRAPPQPLSSLLLPLAILLLAFPLLLGSLRLLPSSVSLAQRALPPHRAIGPLSASARRGPAWAPRDRCLALSLSPGAQSWTRWPRLSLAQLLASRRALPAACLVPPPLPLLRASLPHPVPLALVPPVRAAAASATRLVESLARGARACPDRALAALAPLPLAVRPHLDAARLWAQRRLGSAGLGGAAGDEPGGALALALAGALGGLLALAALLRAGMARRRTGRGRRPAPLQTPVPASSRVVKSWDAAELSPEQARSEISWQNVQAGSVMTGTPTTGGRRATRSATRSTRAVGGGEVQSSSRRR